MQNPAALPISAFVICKDEEASIAACLESLRACAEIIVVDSGSSDRTIPIIEELRAGGLPILLLHSDWRGYAGQKQFALDHATQAWCLNLDADEWLDETLQNDLAFLLKVEPAVAGWRLRRIPASLYGRRPLPRGIYPKPVLRLVRRDRARYDLAALVHEGLIVEGRIRDCKRGVIQHERRLGIEAQLRKELVYARLKAQQRVNQGRAPSYLRLIFNPMIYFIRIFIMHRWFLCGRVGFVHAVTAAIYAFATEAIHFELSRQQHDAPAA
jgi:glycosyltransferase involved in cell wall biosynthesis